MKNLKLLLIEAGKEPLNVELPEPTFKKLRQLLCCRNVEYIYLDGGVHVMVVDEEGLLLNRKVNTHATVFRDRHAPAYRSAMPVVGNVAVVELSDLDLIPYE